MTPQRRAFYVHWGSSVAGASALWLSACASTASVPARAYNLAAQDLERDVLGTLATRGPSKVATLPLEAEGDVARSVGELLLDQLSAGLAGTPGVTFVDRAKLQAVIGEMALMQSGLVADEDRIQMGRLAGAEVLVTMRATRVGDSINVAFRVVEVETGTALGGQTLRILYDDDLKKALEDRAARLNIRTSEPILAAWGEIRAGDFADAEEVFGPLAEEQGERRSVGMMGMAAIAMGRGDATRARESCQVSRELSAAPTHCWVIEGRVAFNAGDLDQASALFARALNDAGTLIDWQRAEAANGLGLLAMAKKEPDNAITYYDKAIQLDPTNSEALGNKARMLEEGGDLATAVTLYQRGMKANPGDKVLALLLRDAEIRLSFAQDKARQHKISELAAELIAQSEKDQARKEDGWSRGPVTVTLLPFEEKGSPAKRLGETAFLESSVGAQIESLPGVEMVDRALLSTVLEELQLSSSALGDEATALKVGRVVSARVLVGGTIVRMPGESQLSMKLIETETTRIVGSVNEIFAGGERLSKVSKRIGALLTDKVRAVFPPRGRVTKKQGKRLQVNVGENAGVVAGELFTVYAAKKNAVLAEAKAVDVGVDSSWLELEIAAKVPRGARVERKP